MPPTPGCQFRTVLRFPVAAGVCLLLSATRASAQPRTQASVEAADRTLLCGDGATLVGERGQIAASCTIPNLYAYGLESYIDPSRPGGYVTSSGSTSADFANTARITGVAVVDANGNDLTGLLNYSFANGLHLFATAAVPEPSTRALLAGGVAGLLVVAHRRRSA
jgi:hypothetical protein